MAGSVVSSGLESTQALFKQHPKKFAVFALALSGGLGLHSLWRVGAEDGGYRREFLMTRLMGRVSLASLPEGETEKLIFDPAEHLPDEPWNEEALHRLLERLSLSYEPGDDFDQEAIGESCKIPYVPHSIRGKEENREVSQKLSSWVRTLPGRLGVFLQGCLQSGSFDAPLKKLLSQVFPMKGLGAASRLLILAYLTRKVNLKIKDYLIKNNAFFEKYAGMIELVVLLGLVAKMEVWNSDESASRVFIGENLSPIRILDLSRECWQNHSLKPVPHLEKDVGEIAERFQTWKEGFGGMQVPTSGILLDGSQRDLSHLALGLVQHWDEETYGERPRVIQVDGENFTAYCRGTGSLGFEVLGHFFKGVRGSNTILYMTGLEKVLISQVQEVLSKFLLESQNGSFFLIASINPDIGSPRGGWDNLAGSIRMSISPQEVGGLEAALVSLIDEFERDHLVEVTPEARQLLATAVFEHNAVFEEESRGLKSSAPPLQNAENILTRVSKKLVSDGQAFLKSEGRYYQKLERHLGFLRLELRRAVKFKNPELEDRYSRMIYFGEALRKKIFSQLLQNRTISAQFLGDHLKLETRHLFTVAREDELNRLNQFFEELEADFPGYEDQILKIGRRMASWYSRDDQTAGGPQSFFLFGPSRTGKSELARRLGRGLPNALGLLPGSSGVKESGEFYFEISCSSKDASAIIGELQNQLIQANGKVCIIRFDEIEKAQLSDFTDIFSGLLEFFESECAITDNRHSAPGIMAPQVNIKMGQIIFLFTSNLAQNLDQVPQEGEKARQVLVEARSGSVAKEKKPRTLCAFEPFLNRMEDDQLLPMWFPNDAAAQAKLFKKVLNERLTAMMKKASLKFDDKEVGAFLKEQEVRSFLDLNQLCGSLVNNALGKRRSSEGKDSFHFPTDFEVS